jgi:hypothetical protein
LAERKVREKYDELPKATGTRGTARGRDVSGGAILVPPENDAPTQAELGLEKKRAARMSNRAAPLCVVATEGETAWRQSISSRQY